MIGQLHFRGTPIVKTQREATAKQTVFLYNACTEFVNEERDFLIRLLGGKSNYERSSSVRENAKKRLVDPREIKREA
jgi:hypothetical protein